jgi:hypothetical protein
MKIIMKYWGAKTMKNFVPEVRSKWSRDGKIMIVTDVKNIVPGHPERPLICYEYHQKNIPQNGEWVYFGEQNWRAVWEEENIGQE